MLSKCCSNGQTLAWIPRRNARGFRNDHYYVGYHPNVREFAELTEVRKAGSYQSLDGWVDEYWVICPDCKGEGDHLLTCHVCGGNGKLTSNEDLALKAAESEIRASDEDPVLILQRRGLL